jgi:MYXO-CTERM domain-containing protein
MPVLAPLLLSAVALAGPPAGERWVRARLPSPADRDAAHALGVGFLEGGRDGWRHLALTPAQADALAARGVRLEDLPLPPPDATDGYPTPAEMADALAELADAHPDLATRVQLGRSAEGRGIWALRIRATDTPAVGWRILGDHHGDEPSSGVLALATAEHLLSGYGEDEAVTALLDRDEVWIAPMVNPDGVARDSRYNANVVDLNRNYAHEWSASEFRAGDAPFSEPETHAVRAHGAWTALGAGLSMHSGETNLGWVWNHTAAATADAALLEGMAHSYGLACTTPGFWVTNGAEWYPTRGDTNDWSYGRHGVLDFTLEVTLDKSPPESTLPAVVEDHLPGVMAFLAWPHRAWGTVVDADTGLPLPATLTLGDGPLSTGPDGRFGRPAPAGGISATVSAPGYTPQTVALGVDAAATIALEPVALAASRPDPAVLPVTGAGTFTLSDAAAAVSLVRPGEPPVAATGAGDTWSVDPRALAPGPWSLVVDGAVAPRSLFIGERDDRVRIDTVDTDEAPIVLSGEGFGPGTRVWALGGVARTPIPLPVILEDGGRLELDAEPIEDLPEPIDLVVLSAGYQLAVVDLFGDAAVDTGAPPGGDTGTAGDSGGPDPASPEAEAPRGCGCQTSPAVPAGTLVVTLLLAIRRRSR